MDGRRGGQDVRHGIWWALMGLLGCRLLGFLGQLGTTLATVAGLSGETRVLAVLGQGIPLAALIGGVGSLLATTALQTALLCWIAWRAAPVRWSVMVAATLVGILLALTLPLLEGGVGATSAFGVSRLGVEELAAFSQASSLLGLLQLWLGVAPLLAALITVVIRARGTRSGSGATAAGGAAS